MYKVSLLFCFVAAGAALTLPSCDLNLDKIFRTPNLDHYEIIERNNLIENDAAKLVEYPQKPVANAQVSLRFGGCYPNVVVEDSILTDQCSLPLASSGLYPSLYPSGCSPLSPLAPLTPLAPWAPLAPLASKSVLPPYGWPGYSYGYKSGYPYDSCKGALPAAEIIAPEVLQQTIVEKAPTVAYTTIETVEPSCAPAPLVVAQPEVIQVETIDAGCADSYYPGAGLCGDVYPYPSAGLCGDVYPYAGTGLCGDVYPYAGSYPGSYPYPGAGLYGDVYSYPGSYPYSGKDLLTSYPLAGCGNLVAPQACNPCSDHVTVSKEPCAITETVVEVEPLQTVTKEIIETVPATVVSEVETPVVYTSGYRSTSEAFFASAIPQKTKTIVYQEPTITEVVSVTNPIIPVVEQTEVIEAAPQCSPCDNVADLLPGSWAAGPWGYGSWGYGGYGPLGNGPWGYGGYGPLESGSYLKGGPYLSDASYCKDGSYLSDWSYGKGGPYLSDASYCKDGSYLSDWSYGKGGPYLSDWSYGKGGPYLSDWSYGKGGPYVSEWSNGKGWPLAGDWPLIGGGAIVQDGSLIKGAPLCGAPLITETAVVQEVPIIKEAIVKEVPYTTGCIAPYPCSPCAY